MHAAGCLWLVRIGEWVHDGTGGSRSRERGIPAARVTDSAMAGASVLCRRRHRRQHRQHTPALAPASPTSLLLLACCYRGMDINTTATASHVGRSPLERGCMTDGGSGQYTVDMSFDDGEIGGPTTMLKIALDTGSANLQVISTACTSCLNYTTVQYPGPVRGPHFSLNGGRTFGTYLGHATSAITIGELQLNAIEFSPIIYVTPRFFQGARQPGDNCYNAWQVCIHTCSDGTASIGCGPSQTLTQMRCMDAACVSRGSLGWACRRWRRGGSAPPWHSLSSKGQAMASRSRLAPGLAPRTTSKLPTWGTSGSVAGTPHTPTERRSGSLLRRVKTHGHCARLAARNRTPGILTRTYCLLGHRGTGFLRLPSEIEWYCTMYVCMCWDPAVGAQHTYTD